MDIHTHIYIYTHTYIYIILIVRYPCVDMYNSDVTYILWKPRLFICVSTEAAGLHAEASGELCGSAPWAFVYYKAKDQRMKGLHV